jgi:hypothetical protein
MIPQNRFKLTRQAMLLATISAAFPVTAYCAAGRVDFVIGNVESVAADGRRHPLNKGAEINAGESISTAAGARAQVRFTDGGYVSLQPNTLFRVDEFNYQNKTDGGEKGFFSLLKGGLRAITGAIGHVNKQTYQVKTPAATLGIRGTGYTMALRDDGLFVNVGEGAISLNNNAGLLVVTAGNAAFVANFNSAPTPTTAPPLAPPKDLPPPLFTVADTRDSSGNLIVVPNIPNLPTGPGYAMTFANTGGVNLFGISASVLTGVIATFTGTSQLVQYQYAPIVAGPQTGSLGAATVSFSATDGIIGWGRWSGGPTTGNAPPNPITGTFDYVIGIPTAVMPTTGQATYSLIGFTTPTDTAGTPGYTLTGAALNVNFAATGPQVGVAMTVTNGLNNTYAVTGTAIIAGSNFTGTGSAPSNLSVCTGSCTATINGFFAGANAARAGLAYNINDGAVGNHVQGVAAFTRN